MGYRLTSLANLPFDENIDLYIFSIGETQWEGGLTEIINRNFDLIAREIGSNAIIVGALQEEFHGEVVKVYLGKHHSELQNLMPALLVTDAHPRDLNDDSLRIIIPLRETQRHYEVVDDFLSELISFVRGEDDRLLKTLEGAPTYREVFSDIIELNLPIFPLVTINVNEAIGHFQAWQDRTHRKNNMNL